MEKCKLLVLDLDGTVRQSKSGEFINGPDDVELIPGVAIQLLRKKEEGYAIYGWTNQAGVAYGFKDEETPFYENAAMLGMLEREVGDSIFEEIVVSILHPKSKGKYKAKTFLRKPSVGGFAVIEQICIQKGIIPDWDNSMFVGDRPEDQASAALADIKFQWAKDFFGF